jgi:hypothetical protein
MNTNVRISQVCFISLLSILISSRKVRLLATWWLAFLVGERYTVCFPVAHGSVSPRASKGDQRLLVFLAKAGLLEVVSPTLIRRLDPRAL